MVELLPRYKNEKERSCRYKVHCKAISTTSLVQRLEEDNEDDEDDLELIIELLSDSF